MYSTSTYVANKIASGYTRERIRDAEARRAVRAARAAARERRPVDDAIESAAPVRRWWVFAARTTPA